MMRSLAVAPLYGTESTKGFSAFFRDDRDAKFGSTKTNAAPGS
jgi:hypothetical protein